MKRFGHSSFCRPWFVGITLSIAVSASCGSPKGRIANDTIGGAGGKSDNVTGGRSAATTLSSGAGMSSTLNGGGTAGGISTSNGGHGATAGEPSFQAGAAGGVRLAPRTCVFTSAPRPMSSNSTAGSGSRDVTLAGAPNAGVPNVGVPNAGAPSAGAPASRETEAGGTVGVIGVAGAPSSYDIRVTTSALIGPYLTDSAGMTLYIWHNDVPGDCANSPIGNCTANDCVRAWPVFNAGPRVLPPMLNDGFFGTIERGDGLTQTTYWGWPLYYYFGDAVPGGVTGQGKGIWHVAQVILPNIITLRSGQLRYFADGDGRTLYVLASDVHGTSTTPPKSACDASCIAEYPPFELRSINPALYLDRTAFTSFVRDDGILQIAYKGVPLYWSQSDGKPGDRAGIDEAHGWAVAVP